MIKYFIWFLPFCGFSQTKQDYVNFIEEFTPLTVNEIDNYSKIYFVRFDYCSGTDYCGKQNFSKLVDTTAMTSTLFLVDTLYQKSILPSYMCNKNIIYISREKLERKGIFSNHTILLVPKKRKIKKLK